MSKLLMLSARCLVFGLFIVCNAVICSSAVWHLSLLQAIHRSSRVDAYMIFVGALSLAFIFTVIWVDIIRKNALTSRVWFECAWVGLFWILDIGGAIAQLTAFPGPLCTSEVKTNLSQSCASTKVLLAFSWICTISLFVYLVLLAVSALLHYRENSEIWRTGVRDFHWFASHQSLKGSPTTTSYPEFRSRFHPPKSLTLAAPQARRPVPTPIFTQRSTINSQYEIEHFKAPNLGPSDLDERPVPPIPAAPAPEHLVRNTRDASAQSLAAPALYPEHLRIKFPAASRSPSSSLPREGQASNSGSTPIQTPPQPLGEWPRTDALSRPPTNRHKPLPIPTTTAPQRSTPTEPVPRSRTTSSSNNPPASPTARPRGPRSRTGSRTSSLDSHRPPPLDLSNISAFRQIDDKLKKESRVISLE